MPASTLTKLSSASPRSSAEIADRLRGSSAKSLLRCCIQPPLHPWLRHRTATAVVARAAAVAAASANDVTLEVPEGPFYVDPKTIPFRTDIREGQEGLPLKIRLTVLDDAGAPLSGAFLDFWQSNAMGHYSAVNGANDPTRFLRGIVQTNQKGIVEVDTIFPGWYDPRTPHIHVKVHVSDDQTPKDSREERFADSHIVHTGQFFFEDDFNAKVFNTVEPYASRMKAENDTFKKNGEDKSYKEGGWQQVMEMELVNPNRLEDGLIGRITMKVSPTAHNK